MQLLNEIKSYNVILLTYFILLPFVFLSSTVDAFLLPRQLATNLFVFFLLIFLLKDSKSISIFKIDLTTLLFFGFIIFCGLSFLNSQLIDISHATLSKYLTYFLFLLVIKHLIINSLLKTNQIVIYVIIFGVVSIFIAVLAFINKTINGQNLFRQVDFMSGTFGNKNFLSSILFICLPFYFIGISISKKLKIISITAIIFTLALLVLLRTRTVLIALALFGFLILLYFIKQKYSRKILIIVLVSLVSIITITSYYFISIKNNLHSSSNIKIQYFYRLLSSKTFETRLEFWQQAIYIIKDNFLNGIGLGNWASVHPKYGLNHFSNLDIQNGKMIISSTHNDFLQVFLEIGVFGFLCFVGIFATVLYQAYWLSKNEQKSVDRKNASYFLFFIICYLIIAFFDFPLSRIEHQIVLLIVFSTINAKYLVAKKPKTFTISSSYLFIFSFALLFYSSTVLLYRINGEMHLRKAFLVEKNNDNTTFVFELKKAKNPFFSTDNFAIPLDWHIGKVLFKKNAFEESLQHYNEAYKINPYSIVVNNDLATAFVKNNNTLEAIKYYKEALVISTNYIDARLNLAATYYNNEQFENAFKTIDQYNGSVTNKFYNQILTPIVEKKLNNVLVQLNNDKLNNYLKSKIKSEIDLRKFYYEYKKNNSTFDEYIQSLIH